MPSEASGTRTAVTSAEPAACGGRCTGFQMRRAPAGIAVTDFSGSGEPWEKGRTESWKVPNVALPAQPAGLAAVAGAAAGASAAASGTASSSAITIWFTVLRRAELEKS